MFLGAPLSLLIVKTKTVRVSDGTTPLLPPKTTWSSAYTGVYVRLQRDPYIIAMFPLMFASNYYLPYEFNDINLTRFNVRTRALNVILFYSGGILGAYSAGLTLDVKLISRRSRTLLAVFTLLAVSTAAFAAAYLWQGSVSREDTESIGFPLIDCTDAEYLAPLLLFLWFGFSHFVLQNCIYWFISMLAEGSTAGSASDFAGFFKSLQAAGAALSWRISNEQYSFNTNLVTAWVMVAVSLLLVTPMLLLRIGNKR
jgi:hypothetical protein